MIHSEIFNLINCAQARWLEAMRASDWARARREGETVAHYADRLTLHWSLYKSAA